MAPRATWKGHLKLSLVSCAVAVFPATTTSQRIHFNVINRKTGNRVHYKVVDAETGREVDQDERIKGYKQKGGDYVLLEDEDFDAVALESTHTIDIEAFVPREEVDEIYLDESLYIVPTDDVGVEAYNVIRKAMEKENLVGLARVVMYRRERLLMLEPRGKGIAATALRYREEVRDEEDYFEDIPSTRTSSDMMDLAVHILKSKVTKFDPDRFEDRYETALKKLIAAKKAGKEPPEPPAPRESNVINLMDALRKSVKAETEPGSSPKRSRASARKRAPAKRKLKKAS